ncbi:MAG: WYL domain-containing protein [Bacteroidales bacterium]|nr:WYL domain-containing protein [Bacteroidales bacterium]
MALNKYATIRYRVIDRFLRSRSHPFPSKERLRQACEEELYGSGTGENISISTIEKDLWAMKNEASLGYAPIVYSKAENGYYYSDPEFSLDLPLTEEDIDLIRLATSTLSQFKDSQIFKDLETSVEKIRGRLKVYKQIESKDNNRLIRFETAPFFAGSEYLSELLDAIKDHQEVKISYIPFTDDTIRNYHIRPYFLQEHKNRWYLICFENDTEKYRTLGLDRIQELIIQDSHFHQDPEFDPEDYYKYSFGIGIYSGKPVEVILSFDSIQGRYIKAQPIHSTQKIIKESDNQLLIQVSIIPSPEFMMRLMSYGSSVQVIEPELIRNSLIDLLKAALEKYE